MVHIVKDQHRNAASHCQEQSSCPRPQTIILIVLKRYGMHTIAFTVNEKLSTYNENY